MILFALQFDLAWLALRGPSAFARDPRAMLGAIASAALWGLVSTGRGVRAIRVVAATLVGLIAAIDAWIVRYYGAPLDRRIAESAAHAWADVRPVVLPILPFALVAWVAVAAIEYAWLGRAARPWETKVRLPLAIVAVLGLALGRLDAAPPDLRAIGALAALRHRDEAPPVARAAAQIPLLPSAKERAPSVLFILSESVRASSYCSARRDGCPFTPALDAALPDRVGLDEMRSIASYTAVSVSAILTGRTQEGPRAAVDRAPTLFDLARAVRVGDLRVAVAYWSAQSATVLPRDVQSSLDSRVTLEDLLGHAVDDEDDVVPLGVDRMLLSRALHELPALARPHLVVLHLAGTHAPYFVDEAHAPFRPLSHVVTWSGLPELRSAYEDAIVEQDRTVAAAARAFIDAQAGGPWVILFTSDHGEAFGEHGAIHHGQDLYDEQIHVPGWVAYGGGALDDDARSNLEAHRGAWVTHLDVLPTVLDALGAWRGLGASRLRAELPGRSLFDVVLPARSPTPLTNCTELFPCPLSAWGMLRDDRLLTAQPWDGDWRCVDLAKGDAVAAGADCDALREAAARTFPILPNGRPSRP